MDKRQQSQPKESQDQEILAKFQSMMSKELQQQEEDIPFIELEAGDKWKLSLIVKLHSNSSTRVAGLKE